VSSDPGGSVTCGKYLPGGLGGGERPRPSAWLPVASRLFVSPIDSHGSFTVMELQLRCISTIAPAPRSLSGAGSRQPERLYCLGAGHWALTHTLPRVQKALDRRGRNLPGVIDEAAVQAAALA
jgi:hypothetical protein